MGVVISFIKSFYTQESFWRELPSIDLVNMPPTKVPTHLMEILQSIRNYQGCATLIRNAISNPCQENDLKAWTMLSPCVIDIRGYYQASCQIENTCYVLIKNIQGNYLMSNLDSHIADIVKLSEFLEFYSEFDWLKLSIPVLQNDFSFYRRSLARIKGLKEKSVVIIPDEETNYISLFLAQNNPMTTQLIQVLKKGISSNQVSKASILDIFFTIISTCYLVLYKKFHAMDIGDIQSKCKIMIASCIIYDHLDPNGVYAKSGQINMKAIVDLLFSINLDPDFLGRIVNTLKYSTPTFNNPTTPRNIKQKLGE